MGVVGCAVLVDIDPSAMLDCYRAIPISYWRPREGSFARVSNYTGSIQLESGDRV
jgi:hypothetical protein